MSGQFLRIARATALVIVCATGAAYAADTPDAWVTMKTKLSLLTTEGINTRHLNVDTVNGVVTLHGEVPTKEEKVKAEEVAMKIDGAKAVKNLLQVVPNSIRSVVKRSDEAIKDSVEAAFKANRRIHDSGIGVASVNNGVVLLSGKTKSMEASVESVEVADAVRGVRRVSSEVEVVPGT